MGGRIQVPVTGVTCTEKGCESESRCYTGRLQTNEHTIQTINSIKTDVANNTFVANN